MNKTRRLILTTLALIATLLGSLAADASIDTSVGTSCNEAQAGELTECLGIQIVVSEAELAAVYDSLLTRQTHTPALGHLKEAQSKWRSFRDAQCALSGLELSGYTEPNQQNPATQHCLLQMTEDRIAVLRSLSIAPTRSQAER